MRKKILTAVFLIAVGALLLSGCKKNGKVKLDPENPVNVKVWHYYSGGLQNAFEKLVEEYNTGEGKKRGIIVQAENHGTVNELGEEVISTAKQEVGMGELPNLFMGYADTVYAVDQMGLVAGLDEYFTDKELEAFVPEFIKEGRIGESGELKIFPMAKSTEILMMNKTDWDLFAADTGVKTEQLGTIEGITEVAGQYYDWSGGKAFFGRDALANYMLIGARQLGVEIFQVEDGKATFQIQEEVMRKLWDNYYIPSIYGHFGAYGKFRSDDTKVGDLLAFVGSSASAGFFPQEVFKSDDSSYPIEALVLPAPTFASGEKYAVQQGAGVAVLNADKEQEYAAVEFMKWFTEEERNMSFSILSGYLPVKTKALTQETLEKAIENSAEEISLPMQEALRIAVSMCEEQTLYTNQAFAGGNTARVALEQGMKAKLESDVPAIEAKVAQGQDREVVAGEYDTQENFENWMQDLKEKLDDTQKE